MERLKTAAKSNIYWCTIHAILLTLDSRITIDVYLCFGTKMFKENAILEKQKIISRSTIQYPTSQQLLDKFQANIKHKYTG
uniref:Uncharacterized protein n=1 Tax=Pyxicephalus adspersus TaxID=30357 RepID=A0AAV3ANA1_PYXAD|nr:TPA: hypothetical protein GDO54_000670 [Pyxicephalus adspersus]